MLHAFARFVAHLFPSLEGANAKAYLDRFWRYGPVWSDLYATVLSPKICQGDVVGPITFIAHTDSGDFAELVRPGMVLSHSCDIDQDEEILFAACFPAYMFRKHPSIGDIRRNTVFGLIYLPGLPGIGDTIVDLGRVQSIRRSVFEEDLRAGKTKRHASLTTLGYYFLIAKLTVRFLRPQPSDEIRGDASPPLGQRINDVARAILGLIRYVVFGREP
jgi:hypothetical protein